jgi:hypothetical protein
MPSAWPTGWCGTTRRSSGDCCSLARAGWGKPTQATTPVEQTLAPREIVTVTDPCHPLFGHALQLLGVITTAQSGRCCVVLTPAGTEHRLPLALTDLAPAPPAPYALPLNSSSVSRLLAAYARILSQLKEREDAPSTQAAAAPTDQEPAPAHAERTDRDHAGASLGPALCDRAATTPARTGPSLPHTGRPTRRRRGPQGGA